MSNARQFGLDLQQWSKKVVPGAHVVFMKKIVLELLKRVVMKSPVDTGRFRANWQVGIGSADETTIDEATGKGKHYVNDAVRRGSDKLGDLDFGIAVHVSNNLPYAGPLEDGHSGQAPAGVLGISVEEVSAHLARQK